MFAATKLRRGMIPKDKERGMLNLESWGKPCVTPSWFIPLLVGAAMGWQENHAHARSHSLHDVSVGLPSNQIVGSTQFPHRDELKVAHSNCWGFALWLSRDYWSTGVCSTSTHEDNGFLFPPHALSACGLFSSLTGDWEVEVYCDFPHQSLFW